MALLSFPVNCQSTPKDSQITSESFPRQVEQTLANLDACLASIGITREDNPEAGELVTNLYNEFGFDTVNIGLLSESWRVERDRPAYVSRQNAAELKENLTPAPRTI